MKQLFISIFILLAAFYYFAPVPVQAVSGAKTCAVQLRASSAATSYPNLYVHAMNQGQTPKGMAKDGGATGDKLQTFIRDVSSKYYITKSTSIAITGSSYALFQNAGTVDLFVYCNGDLANPSILRAGTDWGEGIR